jgi:hypothetical protein
MFEIASCSFITGALLEVSTNSSHWKKGLGGEEMREWSDAVEGGEGMTEWSDAVEGGEEMREWSDAVESKENKNKKR